MEIANVFTKAVVVGSVLLFRKDGPEVTPVTPLWQLEFGSQCPYNKLTSYPNL